MDIESILGIDDTDPESRHADYLVESDLQLMKDLVQFRKEHGIDQAKVAQRMGIDPSGVSKIESGYRDLLQSTVQRYAMAVGAVVEHKIHAFAEIDQRAQTQGRNSWRARRYGADDIHEIVHGPTETHVHQPSERGTEPQIWTSTIRKEGRFVPK